MAREEKEVVTKQKTGEGTIWLTIFSDMTTNLALFFLILFCFTRLSESHRKKVYSALSQQFGRRTSEETTLAKEKKDTTLEELKEVGYIEENIKEIKITLPSPVLFDINKADLKPQAIKALNIIANTLEKSEYPVIVKGHTDNLPIRGGKFKSNWHLSAARAFAVIEYFTKVKKMDPKRFSAMGFSEFNPVAENDTEEGRAKNRRIEIVIRKM